MKRIGAGLLVFLLTGAALADGDVNQSFGRLFTTPQERVMLDRFRQDNPSAETPAVVAQPTVPSEAPSAKLSGVVLRGDGRHTVWINGRSELSAEPSSTLVRPGKPHADTLSVPVHGNNGSVFLKPGQVWLLDERRIEEAYKTDAGSSETPKTTGDDSGDQEH